MTRLLVGLLLAFASTLAINWSFFTQHGATNAMPHLSLRHPFTALRLLFTSGRWLLGYAVGMGGWGLYITALFFAPLSLVQAISAGGVGLLGLLVWRVARQPLSSRDQAAVWSCLAGLALLCASFAGGVPRPPAPGATGVLVWVGAATAAAALFWLVGSPHLRPGAGLGAAAGLLYAAGDVSTKGAVGDGPWFVPLLIFCHVLGFVALQLAFQRGTALSTAGTSTLLNNALPIIAGIIVFGERLPGGPFGAARIGAFVLVVLGASLLARPEPETAPATQTGTPVGLRE